MHYLLYLLASAVIHGANPVAGTSSSSNHHTLLSRAHKPTRDVYMGTLNDFDDFFHRLGTNASDWKLLGDDPSGITSSEVEGPAGLSKRQSEEDECAARTGIDYFVCEALPRRGWWIAAGVTVAIFYAPDIIDDFLTRCARAVANGSFEQRVRYQKLRNGQEGPVNKLKVRDLDVERLDIGPQDVSLLNDDDSEPELIHFNIEEKISNKRDLASDFENGVHNITRVWDRYAYDTRTGIVQHEGTDLTNRVDASELRKRHLEPVNGSVDLDDPSVMRWGSRRASAQQAAEEYETWTLIITIERSGNYFAFSSMSCLKDYFYARLDEAETAGRFTCSPLAEEATPVDHYSVIGVNINPGDDFSLKWGPCCSP